MKTVLFACIHNAGRSQMAAAWFNALADEAKARAVSAGTEPGTRVHPEVLTAMREVVGQFLRHRRREVDGRFCHGLQDLGVHARAGLGAGGDGVRLAGVGEAVEPGRGHLRAAGVVNAREHVGLHDSLLDDHGG